MFYLYHIEIGRGQYIGLTTNPNERKLEHLRTLRKNTHFNHRAQAEFNKTQSFNFYIIIAVETKELGEFLEKCTIEETQNALNLTIGTGRFGDGVIPPTMLGVSRETREKLSSAMTGKTVSLVTRQKISDTLKGRPLPQQRAAMARKNIAVHCDWSGKKHKESTKAKMSLAKKGKSTRGVSIDGVIYKNLDAAAITLGIHRNTLDNRCKRDTFPDCFYLRASDENRDL